MRYLLRLALMWFLFNLAVTVLALIALSRAEGACPPPYTLPGPYVLHITSNTTWTLLATDDQPALYAGRGPATLPLAPGWYLLITRLEEGNLCVVPVYMGGEDTTPYDPVL